MNARALLFLLVTGCAWKSAEEERRRAAAEKARLEAEAKQAELEAKVEQMKREEERMRQLLHGKLGEAGVGPPPAQQKAKPCNCAPGDPLCSCL